MAYVLVLSLLGGCVFSSEWDMEIVKTHSLKVEAGDEEIDSFDFALMKMNEKE